LGKIDVLKYHPEWVDGGPGLPGPVLRTAITEYIVAGLVRDIAAKVPSKQFAAALQETAKELVAESARRLPSDFASTVYDPDDICPPYWPHHPPRHVDEGLSTSDIHVASPLPSPWLVSAPSPDPWLEAAVPAIRDVVLAVALRDLATVTTVAKASAALKEAGEGIVKGAASRVYDEYCGTLVKPRIPIPHSKTPEAAVA
jgi:hypothetical protein